MEITLSPVWKHYAHGWRISDAGREALSGLLCLVKLEWHVPRPRVHRFATALSRVCAAKIAGVERLKVPVPPLPPRAATPNLSLSNARCRRAMMLSELCRGGRPCIRVRMALPVPAWRQRILPWRSTVMRAASLVRYDRFACRSEHRAIPACPISRMSIIHLLTHGASRAPSAFDKNCDHS